MSTTTRYTDPPADVARALEGALPIRDALPPPSELVLRTEKERITIAIDKHSLGLFKQYAKKHGAKYQTMMNSVLGAYADKHLSST